MKPKILKNFFDCASRFTNGSPSLVRLVPDEFAVAHPNHPKTPDTTKFQHVESCPAYSGTYGYVCSAGYVERERLTPLRNIKANRERVSQWAQARRQGIARSQNWYEMMKGIK